MVRFSHSVFLLPWILACNLVASSWFQPGMTKSLNDQSATPNQKRAAASNELRQSIEQCRSFLSRHKCKEAENKYQEVIFLSNTSKNIGDARCIAALALDCSSSHCFSTDTEYKATQANAEMLLRRAVLIMERGHNQKSPEYLHALSWVATLQDHQGQFEQALATRNQACDLAEKYFGHHAGSPYYGMRNGIAQLYMQHDDLVHAEQIFIDVLNELKKTDPKEANIFQSMVLARFYEKAKRFQEADAAYKNVMAELDKHPNSIAKITQSASYFPVYAQFLQNQGRTEEAWKIAAKRDAAYKEHLRLVKKGDPVETRGYKSIKKDCCDRPF